MYYVGLESVTTEKVTLTLDRDGTGTIAELEPGTPVTVLVSDGENYRGNNYLVLTQQGITGWVRIPYGYKSPIQYLILRGD